MKGYQFSIIVVSLNGGDKLLQTIESIRIQSCQDLEVIVKDGGSRDGSIQKLRRRQEEELAGESRQNLVEEARQALESGQGFAEEARQVLEPGQDFVEEARQVVETGQKPGQVGDAGSGFWSRVHIYEQPDKSIYEGMNQATVLAEGKYLYFLNCGDLFYKEDSLEKLAERIEQDAGKLALSEHSPAIYYGDIYDGLRGNRVTSNPHIDGFACYRNVPCHQACVYSRELFGQRGYEPRFRVRADYEHFLWCFYKGQARMQYVPVILAVYEGGGFSETAENRKRSRQEHEEITAMYMSAGERFRYRAALALTLAPVRTWMAENPALSGFYHKCKKLVYRQ